MTISDFYIKRELIYKNVLECPEGWDNVNGKCILLSQNDNLPYELSYEDAVEQCHYNGGRLFEPKSEITTELVQNVSFLNFLLCAYF